MLEYLEEYLDTVVSLPAELQRSLSLLRQHPHPVIPPFTTTKSGDEDLTGQLSTMTPAQMDALKRSLLKAIGHADNKVSIAVAARAMVERQVERLEDDLRHFEEELRLAGITTSNAAAQGFSKTTTNSATAAQPVIGGPRKERRHGHASRHRIAANSITRQDDGQRKEKRRARRRRPARREATTSDDSSVEDTVAKSADNPSASTGAAATSTSKVKKARKREHVPPVPDAIYCFCGRASSGQMIACDNGRCPYEWFHVECVQVGKDEISRDEAWYCPECKEKAARRQ